MKFIFSVCQFGDMSISKMKVGDFQGDSGKPSSSNQIGILELLGTNSQLFDLKSNIETFPRIFDHGCGRNNSGNANFPSNSPFISFIECGNFLLSHLLDTNFVKEFTTELI